MVYYVITNGIHSGTIFAMILSRSVVLYSTTLKPYSLLSNIPDSERREMRVTVLDI